MRFLVRVYNVVEIDDDTILEYIQWCKDNSREYNASEFYEWLADHYYVGDLVVNEYEEQDLSTSFLIDEINRVKEEYIND